MPPSQPLHAEVLGQRARADHKAPSNHLDAVLHQQPLLELLQSQRRRASELVPDGAAFLGYARLTVATENSLLSSKASAGASLAQEGDETTFVEPRKLCSHRAATPALNGCDLEHPLSCTTAIISRVSQSWCTGSEPEASQKRRDGWRPLPTL